MKFSKVKLKDLYYKMVLTRKFEEKASHLFALGKVHGTAHFCVGEEASGVGASSALAKEDLVYITHRGHGQSIGKGMDVNRMMAEFLGKETGFCKGKGGCMHIADLKEGNLGANGIVGGGIPIAVGAALSTQMQGFDRVVLCFMGDGATNTGPFHEALNLASIWKLPIIFVVINNQFAMSMRADDSTNLKCLAVRASAYGLKGETIDGNDVIKVYDSISKAIPIAKKQGPQFIVCNTYRILGHSKSDATRYRSKEEVAAWRKKCPIKKMHKYLVDNGKFSEKELDAIEKKATKQIEASVDYANECPYPSIDTVFNDVYAQEGEKIKP